MAEHYSPLRYPGGKARLAPFLIAVMRENGLLRPEYIEPYAGGAGAALRLLFEEYVAEITINDADPRLRCFWQAATNETERFIDCLYSIPITVDEWHRQREVYEKRDLRSAFKLGFATFFLNRTSRSGIIHNGGPIGGYDQKGEYKIGARFNRKALAKRVFRVGAYEDRISISGLDGLDLLRQLSASENRARAAFVYIDPPYYSKGDELYLNKLTHADHAALAQFLSDQSVPFHWLLTYDDVEQTRRLYEGADRVPFSLSYSAYERRQGHELAVHSGSLSVSRGAIDLLPALAS